MLQIASLIQTIKCAGYVGTEPRECETHGAFDAAVFEQDGSRRVGGCPSCAIAKADREARESIERERNELRQRAVASRFEKAMIPARFAEKRLDSFVASTPDQQRVLDFCNAYVERFDDVLKTGKSVIFSGGPGTGKTHLSTGIANAILAAGRQAIYSTVSGAIRRVRASWQNKLESEQSAIDLFVLPDLLILDEVGIQSGSDNEHQILFDILNGRYESNRPTIMLTNLPVRDICNDDGSIVTRGLQSYIGERILDRMREGGGRSFTFGWETHRNKK